MDNKNIVLLGTEPVGRLIFKMSIPSVIGILSYGLYNVIDTLFVSRGIGAMAAGGVAISFPLFIILAAVSQTAGSGAASIISRAIGMNDAEKACRTAANAFGLFWAIAILATVLGLVFLDELLYAMGVTENLMPYAKPFTEIMLIGAITSTGFSSLIRAEGSSKYAMYLWIIPVAVNVILEPVFLFVLNTGVQGAALATVLSQCTGVFLFLNYYFFSGKSHLKIKLRHFIPDFKLLAEIIKIGLPSFIQMAGSSLTIIFINNALNHYGGDLAISSYGITIRITAFLMMPMQGLAQGIQPVFGYNFGTGKNARVNETLRKSSVIAACYGVIATAVILVFPSQIMYLFSTDASVISMGAGILQITCLGMAFSGIYMVHTTLFQAIGKAKTSLVLSLCQYVLCFVPLIYLLSCLYGLNGVWYSLPLTALMSLFISSLCIRRKERLR